MLGKMLDSHDYENKIVILGVSAFLAPAITFFSAQLMTGQLLSATSLVATGFLCLQIISIYLFSHKIKNSFISHIRNLSDMADQPAKAVKRNAPGNDILSELENSIIETSKKRLVEMTAKSGLDVCQTNVMIADENMNIIYMNSELEKMLTNAESDIRKDLPQFEASQLIGKNPDVFHKSPSHQRGMVETLDSVYNTKIKVGGRTLGLIATPIHDENKNRIGTVIEWKDHTEELAKATEEKRIAAENARIRNALEVCQANVMVADENMNIVYVNTELGKMFSDAESDIKRDIPDFDANNLIGYNPDKFHKQPGHLRKIVEELQEPHFATVSVGGRKLHLIASPVFDAAGARIGTAIEWEDLTVELAQKEEKERIANERARVLAALQNCTTNVMVADADCNIVYMNNTLQEMLKTAESDIRKQLPNFDASNLIGVNMDIFHKNPAHQRQLVENLSSSFRTQITVGGRYFTLIASPVFNHNKELVGVAIEWADITQEKMIEEEINTVVNSASQGNFKNRIKLEGKDGFILNLAKAINSLSETTEEALTELANAMKALSSGNLTYQITNEYGGLFGQLTTDANKTSKQLAAMMSDIKNMVSDSSNAAKEIAAGTQDLSQRTEQQASSLQETAASMEEMASTVQKNAENSGQANQLAKSAREAAGTGGNVVKEAVNAMDRIETSSRKIADITSVIDEIAFQINLLALNAAVEAARAGEAGKGFEVVAAEVRKLAQRSANAAKDIEKLIEESGNEVQEGAKLVKQTGSSLEKIVGSISRLADIVAEITAASNEQSTGIDQINTAVSEMDGMTQQNSALVEENAAASKSLEERSAAITEKVDFFRIDENQGERLRQGVREIQQKISKAAPKLVKPAPKKVAAAAPSTAGFEDDGWEDF